MSQRGPGQGGQVSVLVAGLATVVAMLVAVVVDASAAFIQRQGLDSLADGAALAGADHGVSDGQLYADGAAGRPLALSRADAEQAVRDYLAAVGADRRYPGLRHQVMVDPPAGRVTVDLDAPLDLPLTFPGSPGESRVGAIGSAVVSLVDPETR